jgi:hypothetical protein
MWNGFLNWIARTYYSFYVHLMQRPPGQSYTAQAARIEERWPTLVWGIALLVWALTAQLRGWWVMITILVYLFSLWWCPHITEYERNHPGNVPYKLWNKKLLNRAFAWASRRISERG